MLGQAEGPASRRHRRMEPIMAGLFSKMAKLASSPQGQRAINKAKEAAGDPKNRAKINSLVAKVQRKGGQPPR